MLDPLVVDRSLRAWYKAAGRSLPFRNGASPWAILVAEVMSQQTQIERVGPAWKRFLDRWPSPAQLASASTRDVLREWAGLGYNRRALALRATAQRIVREHDGQVPATVAELERLPGIGPYTARAVAVHAFGTRVVPIDVNVGRVLGRLLGGRVAASSLQAEADLLIPHSDPATWVHAVIDLAEAVCTRRDPRCGSCPVQDVCLSRGTSGEVREARGASGVRRPEATRFVATTRWLRGRIVNELREAPEGTWVKFDQPIGGHGVVAVREALIGLERDGFLELDGNRARLR